MNNRYKYLVRLARSLSQHGFQASTIDNTHKEYNWHFHFNDCELASEFSYRARVNGYQMTVNIHGDVWLS